MLLPSPLPCEAFFAPSNPTRPALKSMGAFQLSQSTTNSLLASCRSLQSILGNTPGLSCQSLKPPSTLRRRPEATRDPLLPCARIAKVRKSTPVKAVAPRGLKKRQRDEFEDENENRRFQDSSADQENKFSTPKRQRRIPLAMPLGLSAEDFQALEPPQCEAIELDMPHPPAFELNSDADSQADSEWTPADDSVLVETVLEKLRLSKHEWNDCARILGKDKDSLGRRWKILVGDGDVGLRRGGKRPGRTGLDIRSW